MIQNISNRYEETKVKLDGNDFTKCIFMNCVLEYSGLKPVSFIDCEFIGNSWVFVGPAQNTLRFLTGLYHGMGDKGKLVEETFESIRTNKIKI